MVHVAPGMRPRILEFSNSSDTYTKLTIETKYWYVVVQIKYIQTPKNHLENKIHKLLPPKPPTNILLRLGRFILNLTIQLIHTRPQIARSVLPDLVDVVNALLGMVLEIAGAFLGFFAGCLYL
jgi:hypothetical protein